MTRSARTEVPAPFLGALTSLRAVAGSLALDLKEIKAPRAAAYSVALTGSLSDENDSDSEVADGNFVLLFDPEDAINPGFRVIVLVRAALDAEMSTDPLLPDVAWTWVTESLEISAEPFQRLGGSVTQTITTSHGDVNNRPDQVELEIRASWSTTSRGESIGEHLLTWGRLLRTSAGHPPLPEGVTALGHRF